MKSLSGLLALGVSVAASSCAFAGTDYPFRAAEMTDVAVRSGFWLPRIETNRLVTVRYDFKRSEETGENKGETRELKLIPYFAWCHRAPGNEMQTWFPVK